MANGDQYTYTPEPPSQGFNWKALASLIPGALFGTAAAMDPRSAPALSKTGFEAMRSYMDQIRQQQEQENWQQQMKITKERLGIEKADFDIRQKKFEEEQRKLRAKSLLGEFTTKGGAEGGPYNPMGKMPSQIVSDVQSYLGARGKDVTYEDVADHAKSIFLSPQGTGWYDMGAWKTYRPYKNKEGLEMVEEKPFRVDENVWKDIKGNPGFAEGLSAELKRHAEMPGTDPELVRHYKTSAAAIDKMLAEERKKDARAAHNTALGEAALLVKAADAEEEVAIKRFMKSNPQWFETLDGKNYDFRDSIKEDPAKMKLAQAALDRVSVPFDAQRRAAYSRIGYAPPSIKAEKEPAPAPTLEDKLISLYPHEDPKALRARIDRMSPEDRAKAEKMADERLGKKGREGGTTEPRGRGASGGWGGETPTERKAPKPRKPGSWQSPLTGEMVGPGSALFDALKAIVSGTPSLTPQSMGGLEPGEVPEWMYKMQRRGVPTGPFGG